MNKIILLWFLLFHAAASAGTNPQQQEILDIVDKLESYNQQIAATEEDEAINKLIVQRDATLQALLLQLQTTSVESLPDLSDQKQQNLLSSRININQQRGHKVAVLRDKAEIAALQTQQAVNDYLQYLIQASDHYARSEAIIQHSQVKLSASQALAEQFKVKEIAKEGPVFLNFEKNLSRFTRVNETYQTILKYVMSRPRLIVSTHWSQNFSLLSAIATINRLDSVKAINQHLIPFKIDVGGVGVSLLIVLLVYFTYPLFIKSAGWLIEQYLIDDGSEHQTLIYHEIRRPVWVLVFFFGVDLATYAFFYKTDFRASIENITFVIYALIYIWLLFKILDTVVLVQIQKLSRKHKELRRGLFNLAVQTSKGVILVAALAIGLNHFGISITAIMSTLGIGGLAFALAAKDTLSNLFGGITILFDDVYRMGDWIKVGDVEGTVADIGLRSTTIRTFDNALITIPNSQISISSVKNYNRRVVGRRIKLYVGVTYESNMDDIRQAIEEIREMLLNHPDIAHSAQKHNTRRSRKLKLASDEDTHGIKATQLVYMDRFNDFSIDILVYCFSRTVKWSEWLAVKQDVLFEIAEILQNNHLEFAYPTEVRIQRVEQGTMP